MIRFQHPHDTHHGANTGLTILRQFDIYSSDLTEHDAESHRDILFGRSLFFATVPHLRGFNHKNLIWYYVEADYRLTDVKGLS